MMDHIVTSYKTEYSLVSLICRACGHTEEKRLKQFDSIPECPKCRSQLLVENVTLEKENDNGNTKKDKSENRNGKSEPPH